MCPLLYYQRHLRAPAGLEILIRARASMRGIHAATTVVAPSSGATEHV
jgi:hypothetical protein